MQPGVMVGMYSISYVVQQNAILDQVLSFQKISTNFLDQSYVHNYLRTSFKSIQKIMVRQVRIYEF